MKLGKIVKGRLFKMPKPYNAYMGGVAYSNLDVLLEKDIELANQNGWYEIDEGAEDMGLGYEIVDGRIVPKEG